MSVNGVSQISTSPLNYMGALTPDALMAYCASKLRSMDEQMQTQMAKQQGYRNASSILNQIQSDLQFLGSGSVGGNKCQGILPGDGYEQKLDAEFQEALKQLPDGPVKEEVLQQYQIFKNSTDPASHPAGDHMFNNPECTEMATQLGNIVKDLGSSAELDMIGLQSLMSQRQLAVQMCTQMVSALGESSKAVAAQIGK